MPARFLVASIGNPPPHARSLHSAGHTLMEAILAALPSNPPLSRDPNIKPGLVSYGPVFTIYRCPAVMNVSGPAVASAWRAHLSSLRDNPEDYAAARLVLIHDELESGLGLVKRVSKGASARGHNGVKSVARSLGGLEKFDRIAIGIGRPESRDSAAVAAYVLRNMNSREIQAIQDGAEKSIGILQDMTRE